MENIEPPDMSQIRPMTHAEFRAKWGKEPDTRKKITADSAIDEEQCDLFSVALHEVVTEKMAEDN